ncbi:TIGR00269 family protein [Halobacteriales archaeon QH_8_64_26]|nr:MAG: TIGR00269 family protein [Halobacteriales archaeon QH_8_64_26]
MECDRCGRPAVHFAAYSGTYSCEAHLCRSVEKRVRRRIRSDSLLGPDATPNDPETWLIGLSGGKDSVVLTRVLQETFAEDPRIRLVCLTIHEGIEGYRDASLDASIELVEELGIEHELLSYAEEFDMEMDEVVETDPEGMAPCAYCGVFRRDLLEAGAREYDADKLLTGHNLDDEAQTALMNLFEGDVRQIAKHFDASLGGFDERGESEAFVPRAKPLRDVPEKEIALYAHLRDLPVHMAECPHASEAYRGEIQELLLSLEENHPGTRHSILAGYEELAALAAREYRSGGTGKGAGANEEGSGPTLEECERCGAATTQDRCRKCQLIRSVHAAD